GILRRPGLGGLPGRGSHWNPALLRDGRSQHLSRLPAIRADAGPPDARTSRRGGGAGEGDAACRYRAPLCGIPRRLGWDRVKGSTSGQTAAAPEEIATVAGLTHEGEGVVRGGKTAFVAGALPGETIRFRRSRRHRQHDDGELLEVIEPSASRV